jgi:hypothetical protein
MTGLRNWIGLALLAACGLGLPALAGPPGEVGKPQEIKVKQGAVVRIDGELTDSDAVLDRRFVKIYPVHLEKGKSYQIDLRSADYKYFDPLLLLRDAQGRTLQQDDDSGGGVNARLTFTPKETADYQVVATTSPLGQTGRFSLIIGAPGTVTGPDTITLQNGLSVIRAHIADGDPQDQGKQGRIFQCNFTKGKRYRLCMENTPIDPYLYLLGPDGTKLAEDDDSLGNFNAQIFWDAALDGTYRIVATTHNGKVLGPFKLTVAELDTLLLQNGKATATAQLSPDAPRMEMKPSRAGAVTLEGGKWYRFTMASSDFNPYLYLLGPTNKVLTKENYTYGGINSEIIWSSPAPGTYYLLATSYDRKGGNFTLTATAVETLTLQNGKATVPGKLAADSPRFANKSSCVYAVEFEAGKTYQIDLVSQDFDAYLYLLGGGKVVAHDDDSGGGLNARIIYDAKVSGVYHVQACSLGAPGNGNYNLTVSVVSKEKQP